MCVAEQMNSGLRPRANFGRPVVAVSAHTHTCLLQNVSSQDCTQHSRVTRVSPTNCCCEHTHVKCRKNHLKVAPKA